MVVWNPVMAVIGTVGNEYICPQSKPICKDYILINVGAIAHMI